MFALLCAYVIFDLIGVFDWMRKEISASLQHRREVRLLELRQNSAWLNDGRALMGRDPGAGGL